MNCTLIMLFFFHVYIIKTFTLSAIKVEKRLKYYKIKRDSDIIVFLVKFFLPFNVLGLNVMYYLFFFRTREQSAT